MNRLRTVFSGDLQCEFENLDVAETVLNQIYDLRPHVLVLLGDLKERYNPIDIRVLNFVMFQIMRFVSYGTQVFINLGNHDRVGMTSEQESWLPALARAGAKVAHRACYFKVGEKLGLFFLPYRSSARTTKDMAKALAKHSESVDTEVKILCFHNELKEAWFNSFVRAGEAQLSVEDLFPQKYHFVIGAHFHKCQQVKYKNVWYVGSPFATDWGEANDKKGFLVLDQGHVPVRSASV